MSSLQKWLIGSGITAVVIIVIRLMYDLIHVGLDWDDASERTAVILISLLITAVLTAIVGWVIKTLNGSLITTPLFVGGWIFFFLLWMVI